MEFANATLKIFVVPRRNVRLNVHCDPATESASILARIPVSLINPKSSALVKARVTPVQNKEYE